MTALGGMEAARGMLVVLAEQTVGPELGAIRWWGTSCEAEMGEVVDISILAKAYVDEEGYLLPLEEWSRSVARLLAYGIVPGELNQDHWRVIEYLRLYYLRFGMVPPIRKLSRDTGFKLSWIFKLFPTGVARGACKIAGIPSTPFAHPLACLYP